MRDFVLKKISVNDQTFPQKVWSFRLFFIHLQTYYIRIAEYLLSVNH